jgi:tetratricopeptide (TPR) repeat protein
MRVPAIVSVSILFGSLTATALAMPGGSGGTSTSTPSVSAPDFDAAKMYREALEQLKAGKNAEAKTSLAKLIKAIPRDANIHFLAGMADAGLNDLKGAVSHYEKAVKYDRKLVVAQQQLALAYAKQGDRAKAEAALAKLKKQNDDCRGTCEQSQQLKEAVAAVEAALNGTPAAAVENAPSLLFASTEAGDAAYLEAVGLINERRYEAAIQSLQRARDSFGAHPDILTYLGFANRKLNRFEAAETYYRQALAAAPNHKGATEYYGELMVERGDLSGARTMLAKLDAICTFGCAEADELRKWIREKSGSSS